MAGNHVGGPGAGEAQRSASEVSSVELKDFFPLVAIITGPVSAVLITLWWQRWKEKREAKLRLFTTLMAHRRAFPPTFEWVTALNLIDVVFAAHPRVVALWHEVYQLLHNPTQTQEQGHKYLELLSEMGTVLGYRRLQQTDIDRYYSPQIYMDQLVAQTEMQAELLRVLKNSTVVFCHFRCQCDTLRPSSILRVKGQTSHAASHCSARSHRDRPRGDFSRSL